jgi:hypothetical protein
MLREAGHDLSQTSRGRVICLLMARSRLASPQPQIGGIVVDQASLAAESA